MIKNKRAILLTTSKGKVVKEFASMSIASAETGIHIASISRCCTKMYKSTNGLYFSYKELSEEEMLEYMKSMLSRDFCVILDDVPTNQLEDDYEVLNYYPEVVTDMFANDSMVKESEHKIFYRNQLNYFRENGIIN